MSTSTKKSSKYIPQKKPKTAFKNVLTKGRDTQKRSWLWSVTTLTYLPPPIGVTLVAGVEPSLVLTRGNSHNREWLRRHLTMDQPKDTDNNGRYGKLNVVRWLLWQDNMPVLERSHNGSLALHYASARGCLECVRTLIETCPGFSANSQMENAVTPVYLAAQEGHLDVLRYLVLEAGGSLYLRAKDGMAPVHAAAQMGCLSCLKWMIQEQGIDPNMKDNDGATPVHFAASRGHIETLRWLLRHGAKISVDKFGKSPLHDAAENEQMECLAILIQHGADPHALEEYQFSNDTDVRQRCICHQHKPRTSSSDSSPPSSPPYSEGDFEFNNSYDNIHSNHATPQQPFFLHSPNKHHHHVANNSATTSASPSEPNTRGQKQPFFLHEPGHVNTDRLKELFKNGETSTDHTNGVNNTSGFSHKVENSKHTANPNANVPAKDHLVTASILVKADIHHSSDESMSLSDMSEPGVDHETNKDEQSYPPGIDELIKTLGANPVKKPLSVSKSAGPLTQINRTPPDGDSSEDQDGLCPDALREAKQALRKTNLSPKTTVFVSKSLPMQEQKEQEQKNAKQLNRQSSLPNGLPAPPPPPPLPPVSETGEETMESSPEMEIKHFSSEIPVKIPQPESEIKSLHRHASMPILNDKDETDVASNDGDMKIDENHVIPKHIQMLQKQMALPFIPPKFPNPTQSDCLIKPSEYLRTISGRAKPKNGKNGRECDSDDQPISLHSSTSHDSGLDTASSCSSTSTPGAPPPPPLPSADIDGKSTLSSISTMMSTNTPPPSSATSCHSSPAATLAQPLAAISLNDLQKIQLKRTDSPRDSADQNQNPKDELIAELKMSKDIHGVRKLKEERAKQEEEKEKTLQAELNRQFTADNFVDNVPGIDSSGVPIPPWKRQMLAKKAAERAKKEAEEQRLREAEEKRINAIPPWKRQLLQRKEQEHFKDGKPLMLEQPYYSSRPSSALSDYTTYTVDSEPEKKPNDDKRDNESTEDCDKPQNPWHFQLRKTNSKLFLNG